MAPCASACASVLQRRGEATRRGKRRAHHGDLEAESVGAEPVRGGERAVVQVQDDGAAAADAELHLLGAHREARRRARHHERRHALRTAHHTQRIRLAFILISRVRTVGHCARFRSAL